MSKRPEIRPARAADYVSFYGEVPPMTTRAEVAVLDGEVIGIAGTYLGPRGEMVVFSSVGDRMKDFPVEIYRQARRIMARVRPPALCMVDKKHERAPQFLQRLGWNISRTPDGELFGWLTR